MSQLPPSTSSKPDHDANDLRFLNQLITLCEDKGHRASLKRYWSDTTQHQAFPVLGKLQAIGHEERATLAALFALHPQHSDQARSLGQTCLKIAAGEPENFESHFRRLLASHDFEDLAQQLAKIVRRASRDGTSTAINYLQLYKDLKFWKNYSNVVKTRWAQDFWQAPPESL